MIKKKIFYGWIIIGVSFITISAAYTIRYTFTIFYAAMLKDLGCSRASLAGAFSIAMLIYGIFSPFIGGLMDRYGPRKVFPTAAIILALGMIASGYIQSPWHLYITYGVFVTLGLNGLGAVPHAPIISNWFVLKRGLASGIIMIGFGAGIVLSPLIEGMISNWGWRGAFQALGIIVAIIIIPINAIFQRLHPKEKGSLPDGLDGSNIILKRANNSRIDISSININWTSQDWTVMKAIKTVRFWSLTLADIFFGFFMATILVHQAPFIIDAGFSRMFAAKILAITGLVNAIGNLFWGALSDRIGRELTYTFASICAFFSIIMLLIVKANSNPFFIYLHGIFFGFGYALAALWQGIAGDIFQGKHYGAIFGLMTIGFGIGNFLGPWLGGYFYDIQRNYINAFLLCLIAIILSIIFIWIAGPRQIRAVGYKIRKR